MPIVSFTSEKINDLTNLHDKKDKELIYYKNTSDKQLWSEELKSLV